MKRLPVACLPALALCVSLLAHGVLADDNTAMGITPADKPGLYNVRLDDVPLSDVISRMVALTNINLITAMPRDGTPKVSCHLSDVPLLPAVMSIANMCGYCLEEATPGSGVYRLALLSAERYRAERLRRFFEALRSEGFSEDQSMQILLRSLDRVNDERKD